MDKLEINGTLFHARETYNDKDEPTGNLELVLDENGQPIPATQCICHAYEPGECCCGAWSDVDLDWWYDDNEE